MSTVRNVIDRVLREWLLPPDQQPTRLILASGITSSIADSFTYDDRFLSPEEEDLLGPGGIVEFGRELIQIGSVDPDTNVCSDCVRGAAGTQQDTHDINEPGTITPSYPRQLVFDAVGDSVMQLYPDLYRIVSDTARTYSTTYTEVPAEVRQPMYLWARSAGSTTSTWTKIDIPSDAWLHNFPPSTTGNAVQLNCPSITGYLVYRAGFDRPDDEDQDLQDDLEILQEWEQLIVVSSVAYAIGARDLSPAHQAFLSEQLAQQGYPVLTSSRIRDGLLGYQRVLMDRALRTLHSDEPTTVIWNPAW